MEQGRAWRRLVSCLLLYPPSLAHSGLKKVAATCASVDRRDLFLQSLCSHREMFSAHSIYITSASSLSVLPSPHLSTRQICLSHSAGLVRVIFLNNHEVADAEVDRTCPICAAMMLSPAALTVVRA